MKRKIIMMAIMTLSFAVTACGKKENTNTGESANSQVTVDNVEDPIEETSNQLSGDLEYGVEYSYWLRIPPYEEYKADFDGLEVMVYNWGAYLDIAVTNNSSEAKTFGGDYVIQRKTDGVYEDVAHDTFTMIYGGTDVNELPHVIVMDAETNEQMELDSDSDMVTIEPGQRYNVQLMVINYEIYESPEFEGEYKLIYGDIEIEFKIMCDEVC